MAAVQQTCRENRTEASGTGLPLPCPVALVRHKEALKNPGSILPPGAGRTGIGAPSHIARHPNLQQCGMGIGNRGAVMGQWGESPGHVPAQCVGPAEDSAPRSHFHCLPAAPGSRPTPQTAFSSGALQGAQMAGEEKRTEQPGGLGGREGGGRERKPQRRETGEAGRGHRVGRKGGQKRAEMGRGESPHAGGRHPPSWFRVAGCLSAHKGHRHQRAKQNNDSQKWLWTSGFICLGL